MPQPQQAQPEISTYKPQPKLSTSEYTHRWRRTTEHKIFLNPAVDKATQHREFARSQMAIKRGKVIMCPSRSPQPCRDPRLILKLSTVKYQATKGNYQTKTIAKANLPVCLSKVICILNQVPVNEFEPSPATDSIKTQVYETSYLPAQPTGIAGTTERSSIVAAPPDLGTDVASPAC